MDLRGSCWKSSRNNEAASADFSLMNYQLTAERSHISEVPAASPETVCLRVLVTPQWLAEAAKAADQRRVTASAALDQAGFCVILRALAVESMPPHASSKRKIICLAAGSAWALSGSWRGAAKLGQLFPVSSAHGLAVKRAATGSLRMEAHLAPLPLCFGFLQIGSRLRLRTLASAICREVEACRRCAAGTDGTWELCRAAQAGEVQLCRLLIRMGANVNAIGEDDLTPLMTAALAGRTTAVEALLDERADPDKQNETKCTALILAADMGHVAVVQCLLLRRADVHLQADDSTTAFIAAAQKCHSAVLHELLCAHGEDQRAMADALLRASEDGSADVVELLVQLGLELDARSSDGDESIGGQALRVAAHRNHRPVTLALLACRADVDAASANGFTALAVACQYGAADVVQELLARRADVNVQALNGRTPLMLAATFGHTAIARSLLEHQAAANVRDGDQNNSLLLAAQSGYDDILFSLLAHRATVNDVGQSGWTALNLAASFGHLAAVDLLLSSGADTSLADDDGETPEMAALAGGHEDAKTHLGQLTTRVRGMGQQSKELHGCIELECEQEAAAMDALGASEKQQMEALGEIAVLESHMGEARAGHKVESGWLSLRAAATAELVSRLAAAFSSPEQGAKPRQQRGR
eukprot:s1443_g16.t2